MPAAYNAPITFGRNGNAKVMNCIGIDFSEARPYSWTSAPVAELDVQLPPARTDVVMEIQASPYTVPGLVTEQTVFLFLSGLSVGFFRLSDFVIKSFALPRSHLTGRPFRISFVMPNAVSPHACGLGDDMRELGICLNAIMFKLA
jgi:hypothetical protein